MAVRSFTTWPIVQIDPAMVLDAIALHQRHHISLWDALIIEAAQQARCTTLLTEDLQDGRRFGDLGIEDPFAAVG